MPHLRRTAALGALVAVVAGALGAVLLLRRGGAAPLDRGPSSLLDDDAVVVSATPATEEDLALRPGDRARFLGPFCFHSDSEGQYARCRFPSLGACERARDRASALRCVPAPSRVFCFVARDDGRRRPWCFDAAERCEAGRVAHRGVAGVLAVGRACAPLDVMARR